MRPKLIPPGPHCDGWQVWCLDECDIPRLLVATAATEVGAIEAGVREALVLLGNLTSQFQMDRAWEELHRVAALVCVGERSVLDLARACRDLEARRKIGS